MNPIETLKYHNKWRRNGEGEMCNPAELGVAIDTVIADYEVMQKENDELRAKLHSLQVEILDMSCAKENNSGFEPSLSVYQRSIDMVITEARKTPAQSLADIRVEAVIELANDWVVHADHDYETRKKIIDYANRIKEG